KTQLDDFRRNREERLRAPDGWLSVVGLHWLRSGANTIGAGSTNAIRLPDGAPSELGRILFNDDRSAKIQLSTADGVLIEGEPGEAGKTYDLFSDAAEKATQLTVGENIRFFLVDRPNGVGVRVKDANSETRKKFAGNRWYEPKSEFIVEADWVAQETEIEIPDILGNRNME